MDIGWTLPGLTYKTKYKGGADLDNWLRSYILIVVNHFHVNSRRKMYAV